VTIAQIRGSGKPKFIKRVIYSMTPGVGYWLIKKIFILLVPISEVRILDHLGISTSSMPPRLILIPGYLRLS
jgi:hypothetical protein